MWEDVCDVWEGCDVSVCVCVCDVSVCVCVCDVYV